jgi:RHS repeat-associated protein
VTEQRLDTGSNGLTRQYDYDANTMRLTTLRAGVASPYTNLQNLSYTYDAVGNVTSIVDGMNSSQRQCFGYDALDRLTNAFTGNAGCTAYAAGGTGPYNHTYVYDAIGNLTSYAGTSYTYGDSAHKHAVTNAFGNTYGYDGNGNQTTRTIAGVTYTFVFDYENRLTEVKQGTTILATFLYDANGNRVKGTVSGTATVYVAGIYERQGAAYTNYYDGGGLRRTGYSTNNGVFYMLSDHLKSTSALVARNGVLNVKYFYYPYGARRGVPFNTITAKHFTGQYHETSLPGGEGLSFYNARWYDPKLGRFLSSDTLVPDGNDPQALNRYTYVLGNPLKFVDPTGHRNECGATSGDCGGASNSQRPTIHAAGGVRQVAGRPVASRRTAAVTTQPWWQGVKPPSVRAIRPGGRYGTGEIAYGSRVVSVYRPQTVWMFPNAQFYPRYYQLPERSAYWIPAGTVIADDWWGEPCQYCASPTGFGGTIPGQWSTLGMRTSVEGPTFQEGLAGLAAGYAESPPSLPLEKGAASSEMAVDLGTELAYAANGLLQSGRQNIFVLQSDAGGQNRVIILTRQFSDTQWRYVTHSGNVSSYVPIGPLPFCTDLSIWR